MFNSVIKITLVMKGVIKWLSNGRENKLHEALESACLYSFSSFG